MAEALEKGSVKSDCKDDEDNLECAVCLQRCVHPAQLPCGHIFCFLCVKGFANQNKKCAMCRQEIPRNFIDQPHLLEKPVPLNKLESFDGGFQWFYEGRNGWWQYDERTSKDLELCYKSGEKTCEMLIAGFLYILDLDNMLQIRRNDPSRRRRIKRDYATVPKKGIAGLLSKKENCLNLENTESQPAAPSLAQIPDNLSSSTTSNTLQAAISDSSPQEDEADVQDTVQQLASLTLSTSPH